VSSMSSGALESPFETLELPTTDPGALCVVVTVYTGAGAVDNIEVALSGDPRYKLFQTFKSRIWQDGHNTYKSTNMGVIYF